MRPPAATEIDALATDFDRTLTDPDLRVEADTLAALAEARRAGLRVVVVSGRPARFLLDEVGEAADLLVAENGAFLVDPRGPTIEPLFAAWPGRAALTALGLPIELAEASGSVDAAHADALARRVEEAALRVRLERNVDRVMVLPEGVEKGAGLLAALERLRVPATRCAAIGDGENDVPLLAAAALRIAVANALPSVREVAHVVTQGEGGAGVREWVRGSWLAARRGGSPRATDARRRG